MPRRLSIRAVVTLGAGEGRHSTQRTQGTGLATALHDGRTWDTGIQSEAEEGRDDADRLCGIWCLAVIVIVVMYTYMIDLSLWLTSQYIEPRPARAPYLKWDALHNKVTHLL